MESTALMALSPLDGRYQGKLDDLRAIFSEYGLIKSRLLVEIRWLESLAEFGNLAELPPFSSPAKTLLNALADNFSLADALRIKHIESEINHDVKAIEYFIKEQLVDNKELVRISEFIHFGCTSEDINNLAYGLMLQTARTQCLLPTLDNLISLLKKFAHCHADLPMLSRTHGQAATPTTVGKEFANVIYRLQIQVEQLLTIPIMGKLNGASGNYNALVTAYPDVDWQMMSQHFVAKLGLIWNPYTTQIEPHDRLAEFFSQLIRINTILLDFTRDVWGYISLDYFTQQAVANEVGSSTMPHKINPIDFENAEGNLGLANALLEHMAAKLPISRWQRDLSDSTVLRNVGVALGHSLLAYQSTCKGVEKIEPNTALLKAELDAHWEVLAEPIQTVMRRYGLTEPYEKLKVFTRGKRVDKKILHQFIATLGLPEAVKNELLKLTPADYIGYAKELAIRI